MPNKIFNHAKGKIQLQWNESDSSPVDILISDSIGEDPWSESGGLSASKFNEMLNSVPRNRDLNFRVNSPGGDVYDGMTIKEMIRSWPKNVTTDYIGVAASTASWCFIDSDKIRATKNSQVFIHDAMTICLGNEADMLKAASNLGLTSNQIAGMYAAKNGKSVDEMRQMMRDETLMTGQQAKDLGLVDEVIDGDPVYNFTDKNISNMKGRLSNIRNILSAPITARATNQNKMRNKMIATLKNWGVSFKDDATDEELLALVEAGNPKNRLKNEDETEAEKKKKDAEESDEEGDTATENRLKKLENQLKEATELVNSSKKQRVKNEIRTLVNSGQVTEKEFEKAVDRAYLDETYINELKERPVNEVGTSPLAPTVELVGEAFADVQKHILENSSNFRKKFLGNGAAIDMRSESGLKIRQEIRNRSIVAVNTIRKHHKMLTDNSMWNSNTIDSALQRQVILSDMLEAFQPIILQLQAFSVVFNNVPLEGTDKVDVPYFPLADGDSISWNPTNGYRASDFQDWNQSYREVAVGGSGLTSGSSATTGTAKDRLWRGILFTSYDFARQPYLNASKLFQQEANKLAIDVFTQIISRVLTLANYGASALAVPAASFDADAIAGLRTVATGLNWPLMNRSLVIDHNYWGNAIKDPTLKANPTNNMTTADVLSWGRMSNIYGFENLFEVPNLSNYSPSLENLIGWICHKAAMLVALSPIMPAPAVRQLLISYDIVTDPKTGVSFEYKLSGDTTLDQQREVVECSFGAAPGVQTALQRLTSS